MVFVGTFGEIWGLILGALHVCCNQVLKIRMLVTWIDRCRMQRQLLDKTQDALLLCLQFKNRSQTGDGLVERMRLEPWHY